MMNRNNIAAFPRPASINDQNRITVEQEGMTLRDWFAGQAITNIDLDRHVALNGVNINANDVARMAYQVADAMLDARG